MKPPLILMAHFDLCELSLCPDCNRVSNDTPELQRLWQPTGAAVAESGAQWKGCC